MKVFVAGATGVVGRRAVACLVAAGHQVSGVARSPAKAALLRSLGATPVAVDLFDPAAVRRAVAGHDVVCNLATHIPAVTRSARASAWEENNRIRTDASRNLVDAALAAGAGRYIQESIAFMYGDHADRWLTEDTPFASHPAIDAVRAAERQAARFTAEGGAGVVLRFGLFYGSDSSQTLTLVRAALAGIAPAVGLGYQTMVHLDDAATAVVAALGAPAGVYHVVEDRPITKAAQAAALGAAFGVDPPRVLPAWVARAGGRTAAFMAWSQRVSNHKFRRTAGWAPRYADQWAGWAEIAATIGPSLRRTGSRALVTIALACLSVSAAVTGLWAAIAPHSFYSSFPAFGHWVEIYHPYNEHLIRDVGELYLAVLVLTGGALVSRRRSLVRLAGLAWLAAGVPHLVFHLVNRQGMNSGDQIAELSTLALLVLLALVCIVATPGLKPATGLPRAGDSD